MNSRRGLLPVLVISALAAAVRFGFLDQQSFWFDEAVTVQLVHKSLFGMLRAIPNSESTPPFYYVLAWVWSRIFGADEAGLRSLSAVLGIATVPLSYAIGRFYGSRRAGLFAAALVASSPLLVWYSQEARAYALLTFLSALSVLAFERARRAPSAKRLACWALVVAFALATHYFAVFVVAAEAAWLLYAYPRVRAVWLAIGATAAAGAALLPLALHQEGTSQTWWISATPVSARVRQALTQFVSGAYTPPHHLAAVAAAIAVVAFLGLAWRAEGRLRHGATAVLALGSVTILVPLALTPTRYDKFFYRNLVGAWVLLAVALAIVLAAPRAGRLGLALVVASCVVELGSLAMVLRHPSLQRDDWRSATRALQSIDQPFAIMTSPGYERAVIELYRRDVRSLPPRGARVRELVFLGFARLPLDFHAPDGFRRIEERRIQHLTLVRYAAAAPRLVRPANLASRGIALDGILWDPGLSP